MTTKNHRSNRGTKLSKGVVTVADLFTRDDVKGIISDLVKEQGEIKDLMVIAVNRKTGGYFWQVTDDTLESTVVWLCESLKRDIMNHEDEE